MLKEANVWTRKDDTNKIVLYSTKNNHLLEKCTK